MNRNTNATGNSTTTTTTHKQLVKLEKQCTQLTLKLRAQEEQLRAQDELLDAIFNCMMQKSERSRNEQIKRQDKKPRSSTGRTPMRKLSIGGGLQYLLYQHAEQPLVNELLDLSTIECPFGSTSGDGTRLWRTAMLVADSLWTAPERQCVIRAARAQDNNEEEMKQQVQTVGDAIDHWAIRLTSIVSGKPTTLLKPYMMGLAHNLERGQQVFLLRTYKVEWTSPEAQERYRTTTPLRDWIVEQELARSQESVDAAGKHVNGGDDEPETKRARLLDDGGET